MVNGKVRSDMSSGIKILRIEDVSENRGYRFMGPPR